MGFFASASHSAWRTYALGSPTWGSRPPWKQVPPTLVRLGTKAAPRLNGDGDGIDDGLIDWDWVELEKFAEQVDLTDG